MNMHQITTPALLVDLDAMEFNPRRMAEFFTDKHAKLRLHFKNHKVPLFAWKQLVPVPSASPVRPCRKQRFWSIMPSAAFSSPTR